MALSQAVIIIYLVSNWAAFHRRPMIEALARNAMGWANVLCVNPIASVREVGRIRTWREFLRGRLEQFGSNLFVLTPCIPVPGMAQYGLGSRIGQEMVSSQILATLRRISPKPQRIAWLYRPEQVAWLDLVQEGVVVYETYDEYRLGIFDDSPQPQSTQLDAALLDRADLVFAITEPLYEMRRRLHSKVHYVPNGVDFDLFSRTANPSCGVDQQLLDIPPPRVGYIGAISPRLDFDVLQALVQSDVGSLVLVGTVLPDAQHDVDLLREHANVHVLGRLEPRERLPSLLKGFSVALIPLRNTRFSYVCSPYKLWEYMAAGCPVVSSRMAVAEALNSVVRLVDSPRDFVCAVLDTIEHPNKDQVAKGVEVARQHSWDRLTRRMLDLVGGVCGRIGGDSEDRY